MDSVKTEGLAWFVRSFAHKYHHARYKYTKFTSYEDKTKYLKHVSNSADLCKSYVSLYIRTTRLQDFRYIVCGTLYRNNILVWNNCFGTNMCSNVMLWWASTSTINFCISDSLWFRPDTSLLGEAAFPQKNARIWGKFKFIQKYLIGHQGNAWVHGSMKYRGLMIYSNYKI